jgi:NitT/TauT family transport system permease protein
VLAVALVFGGWEVLAGGANRALLAPPTALLADLVQYAGSGLLAIDLAATLGAAAIGLLLGMLGGFVVGVVLGAWRSAADVLEPIIVALNSMPRVALAPLLVIWFGLGLTSKIVVGLLAVFFLVFFNTLMGVRSIDRELISAVQVMGATRLQTMQIVVVPAVMQWVFAALRTSVSFGLTAVVVGEFVGSTAGLGYRLALASGVLNTPRVFSILLILALVGTLLVELAKLAENYLLRWRSATDVA